MQHTLSRIAALTTVGSILALAGSPGAAAPRTRNAQSRSVAASAAAYPSFDVRQFVRGNASLFNPDAVVVTKHFVFVAYQNLSDHTSAPSTVVKYSPSGAFIGSVNLNGRCDGMRYNPYTKTLWALVNNDGLNGAPARQPALYVIKPRTLAAKLYRFDPQQNTHGGGYDDLAFIDGRAFFSASAPTLRADGVNDKQIAVEARLEESEVNIRPILRGNANGYDIVSGRVMPLNITDPDSMTVDTQHDLVIVSEGDGQTVFVRNPGEKDQSVVRIPTGSHLDDEAFPTGTHGTFFVSDSAHNVVYRIGATFAKGTSFGEATTGSPVGSFIGSLDLMTGNLTPLLTVYNGIVDPTTLVFVAPGSEDDD